MFWKKSEKSPQDRIREAEKKKQRLRDKRNKTVSPQKQAKFNKKIHQQNVEIEIAKTELRNPAQSTTYKTTNINANYNNNKTEKGIHFHGHYHNSNKKNKK